MDKEKIIYLRALWERLGLHGANFVILNNEDDNKMLAAMLRILANEICTEDDPAAKEKAEKFIDHIKVEINNLYGI